MLNLKIMKIQTIAFALSLAMTGVACQNDAPQQTTTTTEETTAGEAAPNSIVEGANLPTAVSPDPAPPSVGTTQTIVTPPSTAPTGGVTLPAGTPNPAHGQPGHQCGIPVGTPLGQSPAATTASQPSAPVVMPPITTSKTAAQPAGGTTTTAPTGGVTLPAGTPNPAHGQPGHQCGIPVGTPLGTKQ